MSADGEASPEPAPGPARAPTPEERARRAFFQFGPAVVQPDPVPWREFARLRDGMIHAMDGGLWLHRHVWRGTRMAHLVSTDRGRLVAYGAAVGLAESRLQFKPLKDPRTGVRRDAWHWDLVGRFLPP